MTIRRIGVLTSGGDAPGMNAAIRAIARTAIGSGVEVYGVQGGYRGLMQGDFIPLDSKAVAGIINRGGTVLGSARAPEFRDDEGRAKALTNLEIAGIDGLIVIGGNGSQSGALSLHKAGFPVCGVASTIDNDLGAVDTCIGVDTALNTALSMVDRLRDTASSHHRAFVVETMGRGSGYLALMTAIACGAEIVLLPEFPMDAEAVQQALQNAYNSEKTHVIVIVAEGSPFKATAVVEMMNATRGTYEARLSVLGHVQRGGPPLAFDRLLASRTAAAAVDALLGGANGMMAGLIKGRIDLVPLELASQTTNKVSPELAQLAKSLVR